MRIAATVVPGKSADHVYVLRWLRHQVRVAGHARILWKSDQEPAVKALRENVMREMKDITIILEESPTKDSQANGAVEKANHMLANQCRVLKLQLEADCGMAFPTTHCVIPWLVSYACVTYNFFHINYTGRTPYELARGKKMGRPLFYFGERCLYLPTGIMTKQAKLAPKWQKGAFAGMLEHSLEYLVITQDGAVSKCRDIKRLAQDEQFPSPLVSELRALPWKPRPGQELEEIQDAAPSHAEPDAEARQPMAPGDEHNDDMFRKFYITKRLTQKYGQTAGCAGCFLPSRTHSDNCRKRIVDEIKKDDGEMQRLRKSRPAGMERALGTTETDTQEDGGISGSRVGIPAEDTGQDGGISGSRVGIPAEAAASSVKRPAPEDTEGAAGAASSSVKRTPPDDTTRAVNTTTTKRTTEVEPEDPATIERDRLRFEEGRDLFEQVATAARTAGKTVQQTDYYQDGEWDMDGLMSDRVIYGQRMAVEEGGLSTMQFAIELNEEKQESFGEAIVRELYSQCEFVDEYTGMPLPQELVLAARAEELDDYQNMEVFREVPISEAYA
eukprot:6492451-Amphidinium_carterae.1